MKSVDLKILENLTGVEGAAQGYFAAQLDNIVSEPIMDCMHGMDLSGIEGQIIPIITDEFGSEHWLNNFVFRYRDLISAIVTFGRKPTRWAPPGQKRISHYDVIAKNLKRINPDYLFVQLDIPETDYNTSWKDSLGLQEIHMNFGQLVVSGNICTITIDEGTPALSLT